MMKNKKLISAILAAASIAGGVVGAQAQTVEGLDHKVDSYISAVEQAKTDIKDLQKKVGALDTTGIADNKAGIEANKNAIATQGSQISQLQQDMAQDAMDRVNEMNELTTKVNQKADKSDVETNKNDIASNAAAIQKETQKREDAVKGLQDKLTVANGQIENEKTTRENAVNDLQNQVTANKNAIATQGSQISQLQQDMAQDAMDRVNEMNELTTKVNQKADKSDVETNKNDIASNAAAIQKETQKREDAVKGLQDKLTVANGQIENEKTTRENAVNDLQNQVTANKTDIATLQHKIVASGQAFNADMVDKIKANEGNINTIFGQLDQGAYNKADGYVVKHDDTIGGALKKLDKNADKQHWQIEALEKKTGVNTPLINGAFSLSDGVNANTGKINENTSKIDANTGKINKNTSKINALDKTVDKQHWQIDALEKKTGVNTPLTNGAFSLSDGVNANTGKINENTSKIDANTGKINKNTSKINALDKTVDKQHWQIDALEKKTGVNTPLTNGATNLSAGVNVNTQKIEAEEKARTDADKKHDEKISALEKKTDKHDWKIDTLEKKTGVNTPLTNGATNLSAGVNENTKKIDANVKDIAANKTAIENEATARKDADTKLQNNINAEATIRENAVNALNSRIDQLGSDANKGIAKASALAALHPLDYDPDNKFDIAAAGGFYKGENAFALGAFYRPNRNVMLSMGTTLTDGDNAYNVGLTFKIGKSGKHTEAGLTTADLYAMIGAMQDKMDQQQKKIEELEAKQAK